MAAQAGLEAVRRALAQQNSEVDRFRAVVQENSSLNERILDHEDTIARQAAALSTLRSEADDVMTARAATTAATRLEQQNASLQRDLAAAHEAARALDKERVTLADALHGRDRRLEQAKRDLDELREQVRRSHEDRDAAVAQLQTARAAAKLHEDEARLRKREHDALVERVISDKDQKNGDLNSMNEVVERLRGELDLQKDDEWAVVRAVPSKARCLIQRAHAAPAVAVCLGGSQAVSGAADGSLILWEVNATPTPKVRFVTDRREACASLDLRHDRVLCATQATSLQLWDVTGRRLLSLHQGHAKKARMGGAVLLSQTAFASCAADGVVKFWEHDVCKDERLCPSGCTSLDRVGRDTVVTGHSDGACRVWDARSEVFALDVGPRASTAGVCAVACEVHLIAALNCDDVLYVYDRRRGAAVHALKHDALRAPERCRLAFAPGALHVAAPSSTGAVVVFDAKSGVCATVLAPPSLDAPCVAAVAWADAPKVLLATVDHEGGLALWE